MDSSSPPSRRRFLGLALSGGAGFAGGTVFGSTSANADMTSGPTVIDLGFCRDMTVHHVQAIGMCERVLGRDTGDPVQAAATEVLRNQSIEVGMMRAWLADWGASTTNPETVMGWMGMEMSLANMPGYASDEQLLALSQAPPGLVKGRAWLTLMTAHHEGGVHMAAAAAQSASSEKVVRLARTQAEVQAFEISQYALLLRTTYA